MNKVILTGRINNIETRNFESGHTLGKFSIATKRWNNKDKKEETEWFNCETFSKLVPYLEQGMLVLVDGEMRNNSYQNKEGTKIHRVLVFGHSVEILAKKKEGASTEKSDTQEDLSQDDLPDDEEFQMSY